MIEVFKKNHSAAVFLILLVAIFAPYLAPQDPFDGNMRNVLQPPSSAHLLGTDKLGRDTLSRIIAGTQVSLFMTICLVILLAIVGSLVGITSGYFGGKVEMILMLVVGRAKYARLVRSPVIKLRNNDFIIAAQVNGTKTICGTVVPRLRRTASHARMGAHAQRRAAIHSNCAVAYDLSGRGDFPRRGDVQSLGLCATFSTQGSSKKIF